MHSTQAKLPLFLSILLSTFHHQPTTAAEAQLFAHRHQQFRFSYLKIVHCTRLVSCLYRRLFHLVLCSLRVCLFFLSQILFFASLYFCFSTYFFRIQLFRLFFIVLLVRTFVLGFGVLFLLSFS